MTSGVMSTNSKTIRVSLPVGIRDTFKRRCADRGQSMSERARQLVVEDVSNYQSPSERFARITNEAQSINDASGFKEPTMAEIDEFIASIRAEKRTATLA